MDGRGVLLAQVFAAEADLDAAEAMLRADAFDGFPERDEILSRLLAPFAEQRARLARAKKAAATEGASAWGHLESARLGSAGPLREALAMLGGMLLRQANLDQEVSLMAHALQRDLKRRLLKVPWPMACAPDVEERYHRVSELIRIRFPDTSVWGLPAVAHEVGHAVVAGFVEPDKQSFNNRLAFQEEFKGIAERETVCDVIATLALGPAFVSACLLLRFMPGTADQSFSTHPAERERACVMLWVLRQMSYAETADGLESAWLLALDSAGVSSLSAAASSNLHTTARQIFDFTSSLLPDLPLRGLDLAVSLAEDIDAGRDPRIPEGANMIDALNAAWLVRRRNWGSDGLLRPKTAEACHDLCRCIARQEGARNDR